MNGNNDSDSEDEKQLGYTPVLAEKLSSQRLNSPTFVRPQSASSWFKEGAVSLYNNDLFKDEGGDVLADEKSISASPSSGGGSMMGRKSSLAAKRQERLNASAYEPNSILNRSLNSSQSMRASQQRSTDLDNGQMNRASSLGAPSNLGQNKGGHSETGTMVHGLRSSYDPNESEDTGVRTVAHRPSHLAPRAPPAMDTSDMRSFLLQPGPKNGPIQCYIVRDKGSAKMYPRYMLFLEDGKRFLLAARKRKKQTTSNYIVSLDMEDLGRDSETFFGKVRSNFVGTDFTIFNQGDKPGKKKGESAETAGNLRQELGGIQYQYNVLGTRGPRKMTAVIPNVDANGRRIFRPTSESDTLLERVKTNRGLEEVVIMRNKPPRWNEELNAYCLNFNGRVTEASVKNFQLVSDDNQNHVILQFGKIGKQTFTMDYQWPISAFQAFSICISSFDNKLACE